MNKTSMLVTIVVVVAALGAGYWMGTNSVREGSMSAAKGAVAPAERRPLYYRNPMNPTVTSPVPAKDDMGMDYIPVYAGGRTDVVPGTVEIDPVTVQNIGIRTARVTARELSRDVRALGRIDFDEELVTRLHPKTEGWIEKLRINKTGERVARDDILLSIYSPRLVTAQEEYLLALKNLEIAKGSGSEEALANAKEVSSSSRERLVLLDAPEHQIRELEQSREVKRVLHIHSPFEGVVMRVGARDGQYVTPMAELYMIADLSKVWVLADVYEYELPWIQVDDEAEMRVVAVPGKVFRGRITYIYPYMEAKTRSVKVRLEFENPDGLLKPEMFANVTILAQRRIDATVVPSEAIVRSGERDQIFVVRAPGKFEPRTVTTGVSSDGFTQLLSGASEGEEVLTSAQFLIDSESKLKEATAKMLKANGSDETSGSDDSMKGMDMGSGSMQGMEMQQGSMEGMKMDSGSMQGMEMQHGSMEGMKMDSGSMQGMEMQHGSMEGMKMDSGSMQGMEMQQGSMDGSKSEMNSMEEMDMSHDSMKEKQQ